MDTASVYQLDAKRITDILNSFGCNITVKEIKQPTIDSIISIYKKFIESCLAVKPIAYEMDPPSGLLHFNEEVIRFQSSAFRFLQFYKLLIYFFDMCGINATFYDIFNPTKKTFNRQICLMITFAKFEFSELKGFHKIQDENKRFEEQCECIKADTDDCNCKIYKLKVELAKKEPIIKSRKSNILVIREKVENIKNEDKLYDQEQQNCHKEIANQDVQKADLKGRQTQFNKKLKIYDKLIVKSPTRLNKECEKTEHEIIDMEKLIISKTEEFEKCKKLYHDREKFSESFVVVKEMLEDFYYGQVLPANESYKKIENLKKEMTNTNFSSNDSESLRLTLKNNSDKVKKLSEEIAENFNKEKLKISELENNIKIEVKKLALQYTVLAKNQTQLNEKKENLIKYTKEIIEKGLSDINRLEEKMKLTLLKRDSLDKYYKSRKIYNQQIINKVEEDFSKLYQNITY